MNARHKVYADPKTFWQEVSPHLRREESKNSLCLGLTYNFLTDRKGCFYQAALFEGSELLGAIVGSQYLTNRNLLVTPVKDSTSARVLLEAFLRANLSVKVTGIIGETTTANFYRALFEQAGWQTKTNMDQGIYKCTQVKLPQITKDLVFRFAELRDCTKLGQWIEDFHREAVPHDPPVIGVEAAQAKIDKKMIMVLERKGELLSMAGWSRDLGSSCSVNLVFTPPSQRKNGYGSIVTGLLTKHFLSQGKKEVSLYTDMSNPTSNKVYQEIGYELVCHSVQIGLNK